MPMPMEIKTRAGLKNIIARRIIDIITNVYVGMYVCSQTTTSSCMTIIESIVSKKKRKAKTKK